MGRRNLLEGVQESSLTRETTSVEWNIMDTINWRRQWSSIHNKRFYLPEQSPICRGKLKGDFWYQADTGAGQHALSGNCIYDKDFGEPTKELLEEISRVRKIVSTRSVDTNLKRSG